MKNKVCFKCKSEKPILDYYRHPNTSDGYLNKCKSCTKKDTHNVYVKKMSTPEGLEKERKRQRDKYKNLNYKDKQKKWDENKDWKKNQIYKNLSRKYKTPKGIELHHWNYKEEFLEDVFILTTQQHRKAHTFLIIDVTEKLFKTIDGKLLDTKESHRDYLTEQGIDFNVNF